MQLSLHTDYALRVLMTLAATGEQMSVEQIANQYGISRNHLAKVVQNLQAQGYVKTFRGRSGGIQLAKQPEAINVGKLVRRFEALDGFVACMKGGSGCAIDGACGLKGALAGALRAFLDHLDDYTLADIVGSRRRLVSKLLSQSA